MGLQGIEKVQKRRDQPLPSLYPKVVKKL